MANAWGELTWSIGNYGEQDNVDVFVTGVSASSSIGQNSVETEQLINAASLSATFTVGDVSEFIINDGWGAATWGFSEWGQKGTVIPSTNLATTSIGSVTATAGATALPNGISLEAVNVTPAIRIDNEAPLTGIASEFTVGTSSPAADANTGFFGSTTGQTFAGVVEVNGEIQIGWGGDTWGENLWGELSGAIFTVDGIAAQSAINSVTTQADANVEVSGIALQGAMTDVYAFSNIVHEVTGIALQTLIGNEDVGIGVPVTGISLDTSIDQATIDPTYLIGEGWGRDTFGNWNWGVNYSALGGGATGIPMQSTIGNEDAFTDFTVELTGFGLDTAINSVDIQANADVSVNVEEAGLQSVLADPVITGTGNVDATALSSQTNVGQVEAFLLQLVEVDGIALTTNIGNEDTVGNADVTATSLSATFTVGSSVIGIGVEQDGISAQTAIGSTTPLANADVTVTGVGLTATTVTPTINAWAEEDLGVTNTWTTEDLAA